MSSLARRFALLTTFAEYVLNSGFRHSPNATGLRGDDVHQRTTLGAGEDCLIESLCEIFVVRQDQSAARAAQGLVRRRGDDVTVRKRTRVDAANTEASDVCNVGPQVGAVPIGDLAELLEVDRARVRAVAAHDHLRLVRRDDAFDVIEIDVAEIFARLVVHQAIRDRLQPLSLTFTASRA